jgi:hypothetical protein
LCLSASSDTRLFRSFWAAEATDESNQKERNTQLYVTSTLAGLNQNIWLKISKQQKATEPGTGTGTYILADIIKLKDKPM